MAGNWRFLYEPITGENPGGYPIEIPVLSDVIITERLSGPPQITAKVPVEVSQMRDASGRPLFSEWGTAIYAEDPNLDVFGAILIDSEFQGPTWSLDCAGFSYYPKGQPWVWEDSWTDVDPLEVHRIIIDRLQTLPYSDLGLEVDVVSSPVRIGKGAYTPEWEKRLDALGWVGGVVRNVDVPDDLWQQLLDMGWTGRPDDSQEALYPPQGDGRQSTDADPFTMTWFETLDCGAVIDRLATETPFDWIETHHWDGDRIRHRIQVGYPRIGRRRTDLRFGVGENVAVLPTVTRTGGDYASNILILGEGEGRDRIAGDVANYTGRPRRVLAIDDKTVTTRDQAVAAARAEQAWRTAPFTVAELELIDHPSAPIDLIRKALGDEVWLEGWTGWADLAMWVRVIAVSISPVKSDRIVVTIQRADGGA